MFGSREIVEVEIMLKAAMKLPQSKLIVTRGPGKAGLLPSFWGSYRVVWGRIYDPGGRIAIGDHKEGCIFTEQKYKQPQKNPQKKSFNSTDFIHIGHLGLQLYRLK